MGFFKSCESEKRCSAIHIVIAVLLAANLALSIATKVASLAELFAGEEEE